MSRKEARVTAEDLSLRAGAPWPQAERGVGWERQSATCYTSLTCNIRVTVLHVGSTCNTVTRMLHASKL